MKRLEHIRTLRNQASRFQAKTAGGAVMALGQVCQERQRLEQEKENWQSRIRKIDLRLREIACIEQRLLTAAKLHRRISRVRPSDSGSAGGCAEFRMRY
jgi:hypothetical protein